MAAQRQELVTRHFNFEPTTLKEAQEYATIFAKSGLCPEAYRGRPDDILIVWQMGRELGLDKMQSLRTLGCIKGIPFAYGDGLLGIIKTHHAFVDAKEWLEGDISDNTLTAYCTLQRKNQEPVTRSFSIEDAKTAGLWSKPGTWQQYPKRMLQHRARGFAAKDAFPDALYGMKTEEEARSIAESQAVVEVAQPKAKGLAGLEESLGIKEVIEAEFTTVEKTKLDELKELIESRQVKQASITATLKGFNAESVDSLTDDQIDKWSNHLKSKESK